MCRQQLNISAFRLVVFTVVFIGLSYLGMYVIYNHLAGKSLVLDARLMSLPALLQIGGLLCVYFVSDGLRLYFTLRALGQSVSLRQLFPLVFINMFFSNITPMATGGGFAQIWYLQNHGVQLGTATAATTIRTLLAMMFIFTLTPVFLLTIDALENRPLISHIIGLLVVLILIYLIFFTILLARTRWLITPLAALLQLAGRARIISETRQQRWHYTIRREMLRLSASFSDYLHGCRRDVLLSVIFTLVFLVSLFSIPALLIEILGYDVDYLVTVGLLVVTVFIMYFSPTPGASGISEGVFGSFFSDILTAKHLVLVTLSWRLLTIYLGMLIGLVTVQWLLIRRR